MTAHSALISSETLAVIVAVPALTPTTLPSATVATVSSEEVHVILELALAGVNVAVNWTLSPISISAVVLSKAIAVAAIAI